MSFVDVIRRTFHQLSQAADERPLLAPCTDPPARRDEDVLSASASPEQRARILTFVSTATAVRERRLYTDHAQEVGATRTRVTSDELLPALKHAFPGLSDAGARTLMAQYLVETRGGADCYNFNLGNHKQPKVDHPHTYLRNVWEVVSEGEATRLVERSGGFAAIATAALRRERGWNTAPGQEVVVFQPPHPATRFRAFSSLDDAARAFASAHQRIAERHSGYLDELNHGDVVGVARTLKKSGYYTSSEHDYARAMAAAVSTQLRR